MTEDQPQRRIMVVEDDENVCEALSTRLIHEGYEVSVATDAIRAVSTARREKPDVVLVDINLPGGDGFDVVRRLDLVTSGAGPKIIFITASKQPGLRQKAISVGADGFLEKPFTAEGLLGAIDDALASDPVEEFG